MNLIDFIENNILTPNGINRRKIRLNGQWILDNYPDIHGSILEKTSFLFSSTSFSCRLYHIYYNITNIPYCNCGKLLKFLGFKRGYNIHCSIRCSVNSNDVIEKKTNTLMVLYGVPHQSRANIVREKTKKTCMERYGVDHGWKCSKIREKCNQTNIKLFGESPYKSAQIRNRYKKTCMERYGVDHSWKNIDIRNKCKQTSIKKYGSDLYIKTKSHKIKTEQRNKDNFDIIWQESLESFKLEGYLVKNKPNSVIDYIYYQCPKGHNYYISLLSWRRGSRCLKCTHTQSSKIEDDVSLFISKIDNNIQRNVRDIINPKEIDIYLPNYKLAIEVNGVYWHSMHEKEYHVHKLELCNSMGIDLIQIFDDEWLYKRPIMESYLLHKLNAIDTKIYARNCSIVILNTKEKQYFLNSNHIQGDCISGINLGLQYNNEELVAVMTFGKRKITGKSTFEMLRFCNKTSTTVVGGASKLFNHFIMKYNPNEIISYADRRLFNGNLYNKLGFELSHISKPNYWYIHKNYSYKRENRVKYQKHKLVNILNNFDVSKTEHENMTNNGFIRIWDCGNSVYKWRD